MSKRLALLIVGLVLVFAIFVSGCSVKVYKVELPSAYPLIRVPYEKMVDEAEKDNENPFDEYTPGGPKYYI